MTTTTPMSDQLTAVALMIASLERSGLTKEMGDFVRANPRVRSQIITLIREAMPRKQMPEPRFVVKIAQLNNATLKGIIFEKFDSWEMSTYEELFSWVFRNPQALTQAFSQLTERNGNIFIEYSGLYGGPIMRIASLERKYGLSRTRLRTIVNNAELDLCHSLVRAWRQATTPPPEPSLSDLGLREGTRIALGRAGYKTPAQLDEADDDTLLRITNIGQGTVKEIRRRLEEWKPDNT